MKTITLPFKGLNEEVKAMMQLPLEERNLTLIGKVALKDIAALTEPRYYLYPQKEDVKWHTLETPEKH